MSYTLGQAAKAVGMSKTSILRSIKAGRISAGRDEFGQWAIEPCELHRVYPPLADDTGTGNGTEERGVTGGETALAEASTRAALAVSSADVVARFRARSKAGHLCRICPSNRQPERNDIYVIAVTSDGQPCVSCITSWQRPASLNSWASEWHAGKPSGATP